VICVGFGGEKCRSLQTYSQRLTLISPHISSCFVLDHPGNNISFNAKGDGEIESVTWNKLIQILTSRRAIQDDFQNVFLFTYRYFSSDYDLLEKLKERFHVPSEISSEEANFIRTRVVVFFHLWIKEGHFSSEFRQVVESTITGMIEPVDSNMANMLLRALATPPAGFDDASIFGNAPKPKLPKVISGNLNLFDIFPIELARQLTLITFDLYFKLDRTEFFHQNWASETRRPRAPNLMKVIHHFNVVSKLVTYGIVSQEKSRDRAKLFSRFVEMGQVAWKKDRYIPVLRCKANGRWYWIVSWFLICSI
jgi:hypothetical protein